MIHKTAVPNIFNKIYNLHAKIDIYFIVFVRNTFVIHHISTSKKKIHSEIVEYLEINAQYYQNLRTVIIVRNCCKVYNKARKYNFIKNEWRNFNGN